MANIVKPGVSSNSYGLLTPSEFYVATAEASERELLKTCVATYGGRS